MSRFTLVALISATLVSGASSSEASGARLRWNSTFPVAAALAKPTAAALHPGVALALASLATTRRASSWPDASCPAQPASAPFPGGAAPAGVAAALAAVGALLERTRNASAGVPGYAARATFRGAALAEWAGGVADESTARPATVDGRTLWRCASVTKALVAAGAFAASDADAAAARGGAPPALASLDAPVAAAAPDFAPLNAFDSASVTWRHLLGHTSGLQREAPYGVADTRAALAALSRTRLILPPGTSPSYSNAGFAVVGQVLAERVENYANFSAWLAARVTAPLAMADTGVDFSAPGVAARLAVGYLPGGVTAPFYDAGWAAPAGAAYASVADLSTFAAALAAAAAPPAPAPAAAAAAAATARDAAAGAPYLSPAWARAFFAPTHWNPDGLSLFGSPWEMRPSSSYLVRAKGGNIPGYTALLFIVPELQLTFVAAWNGGVDEFAVTDGVASALLPPLEAALAAAAPVPPFAPGPSPLDYEGTYSLAGGGTVTVSVYKGMLLWYTSALNLSVFLSFVAAGDPADGGADVFAAAYPDTTLPCFLGELDALRFQNVIFTRSSPGGRVVTTAMPGYIPGAVWSRT